MCASGAPMLSVVPYKVSALQDNIETFQIKKYGTGTVVENDHFDFRPLLGSNCCSETTRGANEDKTSAQLI